MPYHVFQHNHPILLLLRRETDHGHIEQQFQEIANRVRTDPKFEEIIFAVADYDKNTMPLAQKANIDRSQLPAVVLFEPHKHGIRKFKFEA